MRMAILQSLIVSDGVELVRSDAHASALVGDATALGVGSVFKDVLRAELEPTANNSGALTVE